MTTPDHRGVVKEAISTWLALGFAQCRDLHHTWKPFDAKLIRGGYIRVLRCAVCGTEKKEIWDGRDRKVSFSKYPEGYRLEGIGNLTAEDRRLIAMATIKQWQKEH